MPSIKPNRTCKAFGCNNTVTAAYCKQHQQLSRRTCSYSKCNQYAIDNNSYCETHAKIKDAGDKRRNRVYTNDWHKLSRAYRLEHPLCELCLAKGLLRPSGLVHHIVEIEQGGLVYADDNLQALCRPCHERIHNRRRPPH
jgi:5-methylcytosine-specific restriction enzyme A